MSLRPLPRHRWVRTRNSPFSLIRLECPSISVRHRESRDYASDDGPNYTHNIFCNYLLSRKQRATSVHPGHHLSLSHALSWRWTTTSVLCSCFQMSGRLTAATIVTLRAARVQATETLIKAKSTAITIRVPSSGTLYTLLLAGMFLS